LSSACSRSTALPAIGYTGNSDTPACRVSSTRQVTVRTRAGSARRHWLTLAWRVAIGRPSASRAARSRTKRPMFIVWYVPGAVAANCRMLSPGASESTCSVTATAWPPGAVRSTV
jgi:hypothetical protein